MIMFCQRKIYSKVEDFFRPPKEFLEREKNNIWVKRYYQVIEIMEKKELSLALIMKLEYLTIILILKNEIG